MRNPGAWARWSRQIAGGNGLVLGAALQGEVELTEQRGAECVRIGEAGEIIVRRGNGGEPGASRRQGPRLIESPASERTVEVVFLGKVVVKPQREFIEIVNVAALRVQCAGAKSIA